MTTRDTINSYFDRLSQRSTWDACFAEDMAFTSHTSPPRRAAGRALFLEATKRFYSMIKTVEVKDLLVDGQRACALTHYELQPPSGAVFSTDVAEIFSVRNGRIAALDIYFDSAPFPK